MKIAMLEHDTLETKTLEGWLRAAGHALHVFSEKQVFARDVKRESYDLLMLGAAADDTLGGGDMTTMLREQLSVRVPIIRVVEAGSEGDMVAALRAGADDCILKPTRQFELLARVEALGRRPTRTSKEARPDKLEFGDLWVDMKNRQIFRAGSPLALTPKTYVLAVFLLSNTGQLLSRTHLMSRVWGHTKLASKRTLDTHMSRVRTLLGLTPDNGWQLQAVYKHGYRLDREEMHTSSNEFAVAPMEQCAA